MPVPSEQQQMNEAIQSTSRDAETKGGNKPGKIHKAAYSAGRKRR